MPCKRLPPLTVQRSVGVAFHAAQRSQEEEEAQSLHGHTNGCLLREETARQQAAQTRAEGVPPDACMVPVDSDTLCNWRKPMLTITEAAGGHLADLLAEADAADDVAVRIVREGEGWGMLKDSAGPDDDTFAHEERTVLVLDKASSQLLSERTLDVEKTPDGARLTLR